MVWGMSSGMFPDEVFFGGLANPRGRCVGFGELG